MIIYNHIVNAEGKKNYLDIIDKIENYKYILDKHSNIRSIIYLNTICPNFIFIIRKMIVKVKHLYLPILPKDSFRIERFLNANSCLLTNANER